MTDMFAVIAFICGVVAAILKLTSQHAATVSWLLVIGLIGLTMWFGATVVVWTGNPYWWSAFENCETFLLPGIAILLVAVRVQDDEFAPAWRFTGWLVLFVTFLGLEWGLRRLWGMV